MNILWRKLVALLHYGWPLAVELVDHGLDGDGLTRAEAHHIIDTIYDRREGRHVSV